MNELKQIAELFANDILKYINLGGNIQDMNATKVYELITKSETENKDINKN